MQLNVLVWTEKTGDKESYQHEVDQQEGDSVIVMMHDTLDAIATLYGREGITDIQFSISEDDPEDPSKV